MASCGQAQILKSNIIGISKTVMALKYYAVARGRQPGIYNNWNTCRRQVDGFSGAKYKKFDNRLLAEKFIEEWSHESSIPSRQQKLPPVPAHFINSLRAVQLSFDELNDNDNDGSDLDSYSSTHGSASYVSHNKAAVVPCAVYCDGASRGNGRANARAGFGVWFGDDDSRNYAAPLRGNPQTNQRAELSAIEYATEVIALDLQDAAQGNAEIVHYTLKTDSQYSLKAVTEWCKKWELNNWKTSTGNDVANSDLIRPILKNIERINQKYRRLNLPDLKIQYVPGHSGDYGNDHADALANKGVDMHEES